jgi:hypothetical protein
MSVKPTCQRSTVSFHTPLASSLSHFGRPRRVSSIPRTATTCGSASVSDRAWIRTAAMTIGQDKPNSRPACTTVCPWSRTWSPAAWRSRVVILAPGGISATDSVNEVRTQATSRQYQRRLRQISRIGCWL